MLGAAFNCERRFLMVNKTSISKVKISLEQDLFYRYRLYNCVLEFLSCMLGYNLEALSKKHLIVLHQIATMKIL